MVALNVLVKPFYILGIDRVVQNRVGAEDYGMYFSVLSFSFLLHVLLDPGLSTYNTVRVAQRESDISDLYNRLFQVKWLFSAIYFALTAGLAVLWGMDRTAMILLGILLVNQVFHSFILFHRSGLAGAGAYAANAWVSVGDRLLTILFCGVLLWVPIPGYEIDLMDFVLAHTAALVLMAVVSFVLMIRSGGLRRVSAPHMDLRTVLREAAPYGILILIMTLFTRIDAIMVERLSFAGHDFTGRVLSDVLDGPGRAEAGLYAAGYRLLDAANMVPFLASTLLIPALARDIRRGGSIGRTVRPALTYLVLFGSFVSIFAVVFAPWLMPWLYPAADDRWVLVFRILIMSYPAIVMMYVFGSLFNAQMRLTIVINLATLCLALNLALNLWWIPEQGARGAALATLLTQWVLALGYMVIAARRMRRGLRRMRWLRLLLTIVLWTLLAGFLHRVAQWPVVFEMVFFLSIGGILPLFTGAVTRKGLTTWARRLRDRLATAGRSQ